MPSLALILPLHDALTNWPEAVRAWHQHLTQRNEPFELVLAADSTSETIAQALAQELPNTKALSSAPGFGLALNAGIAATTAPIIAYSGLNYPYTPADLDKLLKRLGDTDPDLQRPIDLVSGCRNGLPSPGFWRAVGMAYRGFCRVILGFQLAAPLGWLGFRDHFQSWLAWFLFGDPLTDPNSAFKVFRRQLLEKFPLQSAGDFVHVELASKATFTTCLMDELALTPQSAAIPPSSWRDMGLIFRDGQFHDVRPSQAVESHPPTEPVSIS